MVGTASARRAAPYLLGLLVPAPTDPECPAKFKARARALLSKRHHKRLSTDAELQEDLLAFIGEFANWDTAANTSYLEIGRGLVKAANSDETAVVVDPFSGGGSIPLEALRLGCEAFASDLNPVACLILKTLLEDIPRFGNAEFKFVDGKGKESLYPRTSRRVAACGQTGEGSRREGASPVLSARPGRKPPDCLSLGANASLRRCRLRCGDSFGAVVVVVQEGCAQTGSSH